MTERKMWVCSISVGLQVVAETKEEAARIAAANLDQEIDNLTIEPSEFIVSDAFPGGRMQVYADGWSSDDMPYGLEEDEVDACVTIGDIFKALQKKGYTP